MKLLDDRILTSSPWLEMIERRYENRDGQISSWFYAARKRGQAAVLVVPLTETTGRLVLVRQYRVVLDAFVLEFPAGLIDEGESIEAAARRELVEETGYEGRIVSLGPPVPTSPGLTDEVVSIVEIHVGETPARPPAPEASEEIEVITVSLEQLGQIIQGAGKSHPPLVIDSRLYSWWLGWRESVHNR